MNFKTGIVYGDVHAPFHDKASISILKQVITDMKPDYLINLGDGGEFESINPHNANKPKLRENKRIIKDLQMMYEIDDAIIDTAANANDTADRFRLIGNHEHWIERYVERFPELEGIEEFNIKLYYEGTGWNVISWGEFLNLGKILFHHGDRLGYQIDHHAKKWAMTGKTIVYGHRHDVQRYTHETLSSKGKMMPVAGFSVGCMRNLEPDWMHNHRINWTNGFGVFYLRQNGEFNFYHVDVINKKAVWNGVLYEE